MRYLDYQEQLEQFYIPFLEKNGFKREWDYRGIVYYKVLNANIYFWELYEDNNRVIRGDFNIKFNNDLELNKIDFEYMKEFDKEMTDLYQKANNTKIEGEFDNLTDREVIEFYKKGMQSYESWKGSQDGSDGACWEHEVKPYLDELTRRNIKVEDL